MDEWEKLWRKLGRNDQEKIRQAILRLKARDFGALRVKKLRGHNYIYRLRIGNYRLIYYDDGQEIILKHLKRRNEKTYRDI